MTIDELEAIERRIVIEMETLSIFSPRYEELRQEMKALEPVWEEAVR